MATTTTNRKVTTIAFDERADAELSRLQGELGASSKAEILRNALSLYGFLQRELTDGGDLVIEKPDSDIATKVVVPGLFPRAPQRRRPAARAAAQDDAGDAAR